MDVQMVPITDNLPSRVLDNQMDGRYPMVGSSSEVDSLQLDFHSVNMLDMQELDNMVLTPLRRDSSSLEEVVLMVVEVTVTQMDKNNPYSTKKIPLNSEWDFL